MTKGKVYIISDLKFFDEERKNKAGYKTFEQMNRTVIEKWNKLVKPEDQVILMGITGVGSFDEMESVISQLNGKLIITSSHMNELFSKDEWRKMGITFFWDISVFNSYPDGREALYLIKPLEEKDKEYYKETYALLVVDSDNPIEGEMPIKDNMLSVDALRWDYLPLDTDELLTIYENMKLFQEMESTETRKDITEG